MAAIPSISLNISATGLLGPSLVFPSSQHTEFDRGREVKIVSDERVWRDRFSGLEDEIDRLIG